MRILYLKAKLRSLTQIGSIIGIINDKLASNDDHNDCSVYDSDDFLCNVDRLRYGIHPIHVLHYGPNDHTMRKR